jgi:hypothetical protein
MINISSKFFSIVLRAKMKRSTLTGGVANKERSRRSWIFEFEDGYRLSATPKGGGKYDDEQSKIGCRHMHVPGLRHLQAPADHGK